VYGKRVISLGVQGDHFAYILRGMLTSSVFFGFGSKDTGRSPMGRFSGARPGFGSGNWKIQKMLGVRGEHAQWVCGSGQSGGETGGTKAMDGGFPEKVFLRNVGFSGGRWKSVWQNIYRTDGWARKTPFLKTKYSKKRGTFQWDRPEKNSYFIASRGGDGIVAWEKARQKLFGLGQGFLYEQNWKKMIDSEMILKNLETFRISKKRKLGEGGI